MSQQHSSSQIRSETKVELENMLMKILDPAISRFKPDEAGIHLGDTGAAFDTKTTDMEGFSRLMWGVTPFMTGGGKTEAIQSLIVGIKNGTNPEHPAYWGELKDYDQMLVEMSVYGYALCLIPDQFWGGLNKEEKDRLVTWLSQSSEYKCHDCNWLFFPVLVQLGLKNVGAAYCQSTIEQSLTRIEDFYLGNGWYADGDDAHRDYYVSFAIHYYSLFYAVMMEKEDPKRATLYKERAALFAQDYIYWFADGGEAVPFGRSMTYRFAQAGFWSAVVYAEVDVSPYSLGEIKGMLMRHLRKWMQQPIFSPEGILTIGYAYPNLCMAENYNSPGSPYWALKTFLILALPDEHLFWSVEEKPMPELEKVSVQKEANKVLVRDQNHATIFNAGHTETNAHTHTSAKYEKFVYSSHFGFSVPRAEWGLEQGAFDSMLALSEQDNIYRVKRTSAQLDITNQTIYMKWYPWNDVEIETWLIAGLPAHLRVHRINNARPLTAAEGGFAVGLMTGQHSVEEGGLASYKTGAGSSAIKNIVGHGEATLIMPNANTNLMKTRTCIPTLKTELHPGKHLLAAIVYGSPTETMQEGWETSFIAKHQEGRVTFYKKGETVPLLQLEMEDRSESN
ncbi:DUF2264 domain-containing protein [Alkalicoccobacillus porphyridii]|uniref:DUF2264 domain-containing protein n=1 Tax=Alkalicoccobacillus porphyridii TaxID=2597270 RepID=A0A554A2G6_9BACI|nr:DUF2264 domain-containing protein [Alkalicoccobacillus porphyridii]TSB47883.1 DUF2264 domain-containing protein [Alkalicoccobacillus porphyridii]